MQGNINQGLIPLILIFFTVSFGCSQKAEVANEPSGAEVSEVDHPPKPLNIGEIRQAIGYPREAREQEIEGMVAARILVNEEGKYTRHEWVKNDQPLLAEAVENHLINLEFEPARKDGQPVKFWVNVPFRFMLDKENQSSKKLTQTEQPRPLNFREVMQEIGYPQGLRDQGIEGKVFAKILVDPDGNYVKHQILKTDHEELARTIEPYLNQLRFEVPKEEGKPGNAWVVLPFSFKL